MARTKSLTVQMQDVMTRMAEAEKEDKPSQAKSSLLISQLETLRYLHTQETAAEKEALIAENERLKARIKELDAPTPTMSPAEIANAELDRKVAQMVQRYTTDTPGKSFPQTPVRGSTVTDEPVTRLPAPVEDDPDLLI